MLSPRQLRRDHLPPPAPPDVGVSKMHIARTLDQHPARNGDISVEDLLRPPGAKRRGRVYYSVGDNIGPLLSLGQHIPITVRYLETGRHYAVVRRHVSRPITVHQPLFIEQLYLLRLAAYR